MANGRWTDDPRRRWEDDRDRYRQRYGTGAMYGGEDVRQDYTDRNYRDQDYGRDRDYRDQDYGYGDQDYRASNPYRTDYGRQYGRDEQYGRDYSRGSDYGSGSMGRYGPYGYGGRYGGGFGPYSGSGYGASYGYGDWFGMGRYGPSGWGGEYNPSWGRGEQEWRSSREGRQRPWWDRTRDEVRSWMGDEEAEQRRQMDQRGRGHYGRGPRGYTRSDDRIREDVNDRLTDDWRVDASDIEVRVSNCEVTLTGAVDSRYAKRCAEDIADSVSGVRHVQNNLRVRESGGMNVSTETPSATTTSTTTQGKH